MSLSIKDAQSFIEELSFLRAKETDVTLTGFCLRVFFVYKKYIVKGKLKCRKEVIRGILDLKCPMHWFYYLELQFL